ncbi:MAG: hypothetical protein Aureis2KO_18820 [Aureisphaera sp.]
MENRKANLFIVGAMKAGTTNLSSLLSQHPEIYFSPIKEPHYFVRSLSTRFYEPSRFFNLETYLNKNLPEPLHIAKVETEKQYHKLFSLSLPSHKYLAEASTCYLHDPESAKLIHEYNAQAKIIIILRNPLDRTFSDYSMNLGLSREKDSFNSVMERELNLYQEGKLPWHSYLGMSFYEEPVSRYKEIFSDVLVLNFEELIGNKDETLHKVNKFLGISDYNDYDIQDWNSTRTLKNQKLFYYLKKIGLKDYFSQLFGAKFKRTLFNLISRKGKDPMKLSEGTHKRILQLFKKHSQDAIA